jgi:trehalose 6-phosphate synthase
LVDIPASFKGVSIMASLVVASNRGPVEFRLEADDSLSQRPSAGGLATMLTGGLAGEGATWIVAAISEGDRVAAMRAPGAGSRPSLPAALGSVQVRSLNLDLHVYERYYGEVANRTLWFLHHHLFDLSRMPMFGRTFQSGWHAYHEVNDLFARACDEEVDRHGEMLFQDYHLSLAPLMLRGRRPDVRIAHFTSCPWADSDYFQRILPRPLARELVDGLLGADLLGFMTVRWSQQFLHCCDQLGREVDWPAGDVRATDGRRVRVVALPVGVDAVELRLRVSRPEYRTERRVLDDLAEGRRLLARVDRMEPSKNILRGLLAYELFLERNPWMHEHVVHYVHAHTSRASLAEYRAYAADVEMRASTINRRFARDDWQPVHLDTGESRWRALAVMSSADALVVNPVRDGMNLVCKEGAVVNDRDAVLILSSEAGALPDMAEGALIVNPFDVSELADAMAAAMTMDGAERARRGRSLRAGATALPPRAWFQALCEQLRDSGASPAG